MTVQLSLFQDDTIKKSIISIPIAQCIISPYNPRRMRPDNYINGLAERISRNGFEITRAVWVYRNCDSYEVFAGGTRLEAARRAGLVEIPTILHEGLTEEQIIRLAEQDNENDEYHEELSPLDKWAHYAWLADKENGKGWTQERIAKAKGVSRVMVSYRLNLHRLPDEIKESVSQGKLEEGHLTELLPLSVNLHFSDWLTTEQARRAVIEKAIQDKAKNGSKSVDAVHKDVDTWKAFISEAEAIYKSFAVDTTLYNLDESPPVPYLFDAQRMFIQELKNRSARSISAVKAAARDVRIFIKRNLEEYEALIQAESAEAAQKALKAQREARLLSNYIKGDCLEVLDDWQHGEIRLLLIDPPYGKEYKSNRRWASKAPEMITGDDEQGAMELLKQALTNVIPYFADEAHALIFCDWKREPEVRAIVEAAGLTIKGSLIWAKEEHTAGDVKGAFGPSHERIIHAVKGKPRVTPRIRDVLSITRTKETDHPHEKPIELLKLLINSTTNEGDLVVDLFAGCANTLIAALRLERQFWGSEIDEHYHDKGTERLLMEFNKCQDRDGNIEKTLA